MVPLSRFKHSFAHKMASENSSFHVFLKVVFFPKNIHQTLVKCLIVKLPENKCYHHKSSCKLENMVKNVLVIIFVYLVS